MTSEQLEELRRMSAREITKKYFPMLNDGRVSREQFSWLLSQASKATPEAPGATEANGNVSDDTTHDDKVLGRAQKQKLEGFLREGGWKSTSEILAKVYGVGHSGSARIAARVSDLRKDGIPIESRRKPDSRSIWEYRISEKLTEDA